MCTDITGVCTESLVFAIWTAERGGFHRLAGGSVLFMSGRRPDCSGDHHRRIDYAMGQPWRDRVGVGDGTRRRNGSGGVHVDGAIRGDWVRGDGVGVGDVGAVPDGARGPGDSAYCDDSRGAVRDGQHGAIGRHREDEHRARVEPGRDGVSVGDGARGKPGAGGIYVDGAIRGDRVRGDGVGVGDVGAVFDWSWHLGHTAVGDDGGGACRERVLCHVI